MHGNKEGEFRVRPHKFCVTHERRRGEVALQQEAVPLDPRHDPILLGLYPVFLVGTGAPKEIATQVAKDDLATFKRASTTQEERDELIDEVLTHTPRLFLQSDNPHATGRLGLEAGAVLGSLLLAENPEEYALILRGGMQAIEGDRVAWEIYNNSPMSPKNTHGGA